MKYVISFIDSHQKFAVLTHLNPDGDALGSAYALARALNNPVSYTHLAGRKGCGLCGLRGKTVCHCGQ